MSQYRRPVVPGGTVFFTVCLAQRGSWLLVDEIERLRAAVRDTRAAQPFRIDAWVVLPDHLHCIWTLPEGVEDFSRRWAGIKARFSRGLPAGPRRPSHVRRGEKGIWQRRFREHQIRHPAELALHLRYCHLNPVRHGLVESPDDWPYSSIHWRDGGSAA
ncbi:REP-associated tyrosine transposase [Acidimangrovimonas sediminis]|uniref:REP-associated tyrosine transposase n=1 Tax=Acidimangrovimonas sediminis TaxID=2056283 RepID=UPI000C80FD52|nr:transposase [Acidimangrovimonas sediminis]